MHTGCSVQSNEQRVQCVFLQWLVVTLVTVVTGNTATVGLALGGYSGLIILLVLVMVVTQSTIQCVCLHWLQW